MSCRMKPESPARRVGDGVRAALKARRLTQADLGSHLGLSQTAVSRRLLGEVPFDVAELHAAADLLGVDVSALVGRGEAA